MASLAAAEEAIELADSYLICDGNPLAESQKITLRAALGERSDGLWAASRIGDFGPRQGTGKNDKINARELAGLVLFGEELLIHTAHEFSTANEAFRRMVAIFENWDDLRSRVDRIRYANGEQAIEFISGQRLKYRARTGGAGRGFAKAGLVVYDEAQHVTREHIAASGPAKLANPNSQAWYAGSGGLESSSVTWAIRRAALEGSGGRLAYTEKTAEDVSVVDGKVSQIEVDPADRDLWYRAMPGLGRWVTEEGMQALYEELGPDLFARECLCVWDPEPDMGGGVIPITKWDVCSDPGGRLGVPRCIAFDVAPGNTYATVAVAGIREDGHPQVELAYRERGSRWLLDRLPTLRDSYGCPVLYDPAGPAGEIARELGFEPEAVTVRDHSHACGAFLAAVVEERLRHIGQLELRAAVLGAGKRDVGDLWLWARARSRTDISPLVACTLALWGAMPPAEPERKWFGAYA